MTQQDVRDLLRETKKAMTTKEIHKELNKKGIMVSKGSITTNLRKLSTGRNPQVIRFEKGRVNKPKYILSDYATKDQIAARPSWM